MDIIPVSYFVYFTMDRSFFAFVGITDVSTEFTNKSPPQLPQILAG